MDTIFFNGCIRTLDNSEKVAEAVGIENGRIVFVGTDKEAEAFSCKKRIDLKGRLMLPGFVDTHMHMLHYVSDYESRCNISFQRTILWHVG